MDDGWIMDDDDDDDDDDDPKCLSRSWDQWLKHQPATRRQEFRPSPGLRPSMACAGCQRCEGRGLPQNGIPWGSRLADLSRLS